MRLSARRNRIPTAVVAIVACTVMTAGCTTSTAGTEPDSPTASKAPDVSPHESGPQSPIGYGLEVPKGAVQLGPLIRLRSEALIEAYRPELEVAQAERETRLLEKASEDLEPGETPTLPTPTPDDPPSDDSYRLLDDSPRPDTVISVMRVDGDPALATRRMLAQIAALLPDVEVPTDDLSKVCQKADDRVKHCDFTAAGRTVDERDIRVRLTVDPGNLKTRTSPPSSLRNPVMTLQVTYVGDPKAGQESRETSDLDDVEDVEKVADKSALIWPRMDIDADGSSELAAGWTAPAGSILLLSGFKPSFAALHIERATAADAVARDWVTDRVSGDPDKDVVEDLNEVSTTYSGSAKNGTFYRGTHVMSARGNYVMLMVYPHKTPH